MLVLSRKVNEKIRIGHDITLIVVGLREGKVRLGIDAPVGVSVHREEVYDAIQKLGATVDEAIEAAKTEGGNDDASN
ncbi:MAG: carbon storage regulator CsrA [Lacipirellulaceae bacterium]